MIFSSIFMHNFFSVGSKCEWINLKDQGLVLVTGNNLDSNTAESNGAGKSTLFEAIVWCLWGKTTRGQSGDSVVNRNAKKDCYVEVIIEDGDHTYSVARARQHTTHKNGLYFTGPNEEDLTRGTTAMTQEAVNDLLGIDYETFIHGPMLPQGSIKRFSQLTDAETKQIMETALQLGVLAKAHSKAKELHGDVTRCVTELETDLALTEAALERDQQDLEDKTKSAHTWRSEQRERVREASLAYFQAQETLDAAWRDLVPRESLEAAEATKARIRTLRDCAVDNVRTEKQDLQDHLQKVKLGVATIKLALADHRTERGRIKSKKGKCPTCLQEITEDHIENCLQEIDQTIEETERQLISEQAILDQKEGEVADQLAILDNSLTRYDGYLEDANEQYAAVKVMVVEHENVTHKIRLAEESAASRLSTLRKEQVILKRGARLNDQIKKLSDSINKLAVEREKIIFEADQLHEEKDYVEFWLSGFSNAGMKSHVLSTVTPYMNRQARTYAQDLTDGEIEIRFHTQTTLKSGQTRERFFVEVHNANGSDTYDGNSGGEKAKADLAINFAFSDVVASRAKKSYPQRWFDEPFESLDEAGVEAVMDLLTKMVQECGTIFVVTHQPGLQALFNKTITMLKKDGETKVIQ